MKNNVAIVGSHPKTREDFDFTREDCDIWVFNEALSAKNQDWCKRATGVFQMHKPVIWRSKTNRNDPEHYDWLQSGDTPVIFMQDNYQDVPMAERYPMDEILAAFPTAKDYFTSSVAYAIALAIYKGYTKIEVYGVEMETNTEYGHQRSGVAYWIGFADGAGIETEFHSHKFFNDLRYGYEGNMQIPVERYQQRIDGMEKHINGSQEMFSKVNAIIGGVLGEFIKTYKADLSRLDELIMANRQNAHTFGMADGRRQVNKHYLQNCQTMLEESGDYLVARQEFEGQVIQAMKKLPELHQAMQGAAGQLHAAREDLNTNDNKDRRAALVKAFQGKLEGFYNSVTDLGRWQGIMEENKMLVAEFDSYLKASGITPEKSEAVELPQEALV